LRSRHCSIGFHKTWSIAWLAEKLWSL
jgi:hypothetical protein